MPVGGVLKVRQNVFLLTLAVLSYGTVLVLASFGESRANVFLSALALVYLAESLVFRVKRRTRFDFLSLGLLAVFVIGIMLPALPTLPVP